MDNLRGIRRMRKIGRMKNERIKNLWDVRKNVNEVGENVLRFEV